MYKETILLLDIIILLTFILVSLIPFRLINLKNKLTFVNPLIIHNIIFLYYCVYSPIQKIFDDNLLFRGVEVIDSLTVAWTGALITVTFILIGYFIPQLKQNFSIKTKCTLNYKQIWQYGFLINLVGLLLYFLATGFDISIFNAFSPNRSRINFLTFGGNFKNYLNYSINFLITGSFLTTVASFKLKKKVLLSLLILILTISIYLKFGFRYRLFFLISPIFLFYLLNSKSNIKTFFASIPVAIFFANMIELVRTYGKGLQLDIIANYNFDNLLEKGLSGAESDIFISTAGIMSIIPDKINFIYFTPIIQTILYPIPSTFIDKKSSEYILRAFEVLLSSPTIGKGAAFLNFGEYYYMFGWVGIIVFSTIFGFILKKLWIWINLHQEEPLAIPVYLLNVSYIFMIISRGYMPQQVFLYIFSIMPINLIYFFNMKKIIT